MATVVISEEAKAFAEELVGKGMYRSVDEAVEAGIQRLLVDGDGSSASQSDEWFADVKAKWEDAEAQVARGETLTSDELFEPLLERYRHWPR